MAGKDSEDDNRSRSGLDNDAELDDLLPQNESDRDRALFEMLLGQLDENLDKLRAHNKSELERQYSRFT